MKRNIIPPIILKFTYTVGLTLKGIVVIYPFCTFAANLWSSSTLIDGSWSWWINGPDLIVISHLVVPSMEILVTPSRDRRSSEMKLRSTVHVLGNPTVMIFSQSRISRFLWWRFSSLQVAIGEAPRWSSDQRSRLLMYWWSRSHREFASRCSLVGGSRHSKSR